MTTATSIITIADSRTGRAFLELLAHRSFRLANHDEWTPAQKESGSINLTWHGGTSESTELDHWLQQVARRLTLKICVAHFEDGFSTDITIVGDPTTDDAVQQLHKAADLLQTYAQKLTPQQSTNVLHAIHQLTLAITGPIQQLT
jgi:hypothetical protein